MSLSQPAHQLRSDGERFTGLDGALTITGNKLVAVLERPSRRLPAR